MWADLSGCGRAAVPAKAICAVARDGVDHSPLGHLSDALVITIGDEEVTGGIHGHANRTAELGRCGRASVPAITTCSVARNGTNHSSRADPADTIVSGFGDEQ